MRKSFDLTIVIDDEERHYRLTPSFRAITEIEGHEIQKGDGALLSVLQRFGRKSQRTSDYVAIIHGCLLAEGELDVTADEIGEAILNAGITNFAPVCVQFLYEALGVNTKTARKVAAKKKGPKKKAARTR